MSDIIYPRLSYKITGLCFSVHKSLGRYCREKQYADRLEILLKANEVNFKREIILDSSKSILELPSSGNRADFLVEEKIILDVKAKKFITKEDYFQMQRYLKSTNLRLGMIVNFRNTYLKPKRVLNSSAKSSHHSRSHSSNSHRYL